MPGYTLLYVNNKYKPALCIKKYNKIKERIKWQGMEVEWRGQCSTLCNIVCVMCVYETQAPYSLMFSIIIRIIVIIIS